MKTSFFASWAAFVAVFTMIFNINPLFAGGKEPQFRAEPVRKEPLRAVGRFLFGPQEEVKTPNMDELAARSSSTSGTRRYPCCRPSCQPKKPPLLTAEVPPPPPLLTAEVPPPPALLIAEVPPPNVSTLLMAEVPPPPALLIAEVPPPAPPQVRYIQLPPPECPPGQFLVDEREIHHHQRRRQVVDWCDERQFVHRTPPPPIIVDDCPPDFFQQGVQWGHHDEGYFPGHHNHGWSGHQGPFFGPRESHFQGQEPPPVVFRQDGLYERPDAYEYGRWVAQDAYDRGRYDSIESTNNAFAYGEHVVQDAFARGYGGQFGHYY